LSIKAIAEKCGYLNVTYFCKVFKKYTGKTIGEYRRDS
jgi:two-component system, response regulator YesN